jgi:capsular exopolysaccharide synthesis family protein
MSLDLPLRTDRERGDSIELAERSDRAERVERAERTDRNERNDRLERTDRAVHHDRIDRAERAERSDRLERSDRPDRTAGHEVIQMRRVRLRDNQPLILHLDPPSFAAEQYRSLAVQVEERLNPVGNWGYALTVTSAEEGAGKTLTSLNLALTLTRGQERRVLLVEGDLWRPQVWTYLDPEHPTRPGLLQVLERQKTLAEAVVEVAGTSLEVLTAGAQGVAGDVLSGRRMSEVLAEMRTAYEIVVIDSPPMALLASARSLAARADGVVLVVRAGQSKRKGIERALEVLGPEKLIGAVLNGVRVSPRGYRDYY